MRVRKALFQSAFADHVEVLTVTTKAGLDVSSFSRFLPFLVSYTGKKSSQIPLVFEQKTICENPVHPVYSEGIAVKNRRAESGQKGPLQSKTHSGPSPPPNNVGGRNSDGPREGTARILTYSIESHTNCRNSDGPREGTAITDQGNVIARATMSPSNGP